MHSSVKPRRFPGWKAPPCEATRLETPSDATRVLRKSCDTLGTKSERIHGEVGVSVKKSSWAESLDFDVWFCEMCLTLFSSLFYVCLCVSASSLWTGCSVANLFIETYLIAVTVMCPNWFGPTATRQAPQALLNIHEHLSSKPVITHMLTLFHSLSACNWHPHLTKHIFHIFPSNSQHPQRQGKISRHSELTPMCLKSSFSAFALAKRFSSLGLLSQSLAATREKMRESDHKM